MSTPKNGFRDSDVDQTPSAGHRPTGTKAATPRQHQQPNNPMDDVFLKPMEKPWRSPPTNGGLSNCTTTTLPMQMTSSTPLHFSPGVTLSPAPISSTTTRMSLDLFHKNAFRYQMEPSSRPSITTDFALSALKNSFSMSSLSQQCHPGGAGTPADMPPSAIQQTPDVAARLKWERPFNSLTRLKERGVGSKVQWRRSFGASPLNVKEDAATLNGSGGQNTANTDWLGNADYTFLMSCDLIESCRSLNGEMSWDNGDLEHLRVADSTARSACSNTNNESVAVGCQTDAEVIIPDLQLELQLLREWLNRMEKKVPKLVLRPKWTRETLDRKTIDYKRLQREIEGHSAEFGAACQRCATRNPRIGRLLENRYHRLLLRILEWTYHLETLAKKPPEFWSGRRAAISSPESEVGLPSKHPRLDDSSSSCGIHHCTEQVNDQAGKMRQSNAEGGLSPPLPTAVPVSRSNMGVYDFKHPDTDTENSRPAKPSVEEDVKGSARKRSSNLSDGLLVRSNDSSENEWIYSPNTSGRTGDEMDGHDLSVRKKLSFESEEDNASSSKSWYQYSSSDSDWLQSGGLELDETSEPEESLLPPRSAAADLPEESAHKDAARVYDKEKVHKLVTVAEQMVSMSGEACRNKNRKPEARYNNPEVAHNSECDASSELTSEGETDQEVQLLETPSSTSGRRSATLNRTFLVPPGTDLAAEPSPVVMRNRQRIKPQRPLSFSGLSGTLAALSNNSSEGASGRWAASETALNHLMSSPALSPCSAGSRPLMCHASTQKDRLSPSTEGLGSSLAGLSSSGSVSTGGARQRRRRHSARLRNMISRRGEHDSQTLSNESSNNATLQCRLSASAASSSGECSSSAGGTGSQRSRRIVKSTTLTRIANDVSVPVPIVVGPVPSAQSSPAKPPPPSTNSSPRSAPSDGELGLGHVDETSNFSEQAWDNYLEPYASEAYSEDPPDAESARRLLEFGEDYRNDLDSLSDCPSSLSTDIRGFRPHHLPKRSPPKRPKGFATADRPVHTESRVVLDSDSDVEDLVHMIRVSLSQFTIAVNTFHKAINSPKQEPSQYAELLATCRTNVSCLQPILSHLQMSEDSLDDRVPTKTELKPVQDLVDKWVQLGNEVCPLYKEGLQQKQLHQQVQAVRNKLLEHETLVLGIGVDGDFQLNLNKIRQLKIQIEEMKDLLLQVNVDVHSCVAQQPTAATGINLKEDVAGLYQMWERLTIKASEKEALLEDADRTWKDFNEQLLNLKAEIAADQKKVKSIIDLQQGDSPQPTPDASLDSCQSSNWTDNWSSIQLSVQCDSGISSGSDGEFITLGEREKRLHTLRQLARKMGTALAPGNAALTRINRTLDQTQQELIVLHNQLSQLPPVRPTLAATNTTLIPSPPVKEISVQTDPLLVAKKKQRRVVSAVASTANVCRAAVPYWWRIVKAALPFHLALIALLLAACVMEPSCCNYLNTFGSSLVPKLSYLGGPPPI